jgi:hypothetical protein
MTRPNCEQTLSNGQVCDLPATLLNYRVDGSPMWRNIDGKPACYYCHSNKYPHMKNRGYTAHKKNYCENIDGRLGKICTTTISHPKELTVDHIDGNHDNDDPDNLQTLCACCHNLKTHQDVCNKGTSPRVLVGVDLSDMYPDMWG